VQILFDIDHVGQTCVGASVGSDGAYGGVHPHPVEVVDLHVLFPLCFGVVG